jgi:hypothetical protein
MSWKSVSREVARLKRLIPPTPTAADLAQERFQKRLRASRDRDILRIVQHMYCVLAAHPRLDLGRLLAPDSAVSAILEASGPETGPIRRLTPADVERFIQFWEASQS